MILIVNDISNKYPNVIPHWTWVSSYILKRGNEKKKVSGLYHLMYKSDMECNIDIKNESLRNEINSGKYTIKIVNHMMYLVDKSIDRMIKLNKI